MDAHLHIHKQKTHAKHLLKNDSVVGCFLSICQALSSKICIRVCVCVCVCVCGCVGE